jgi:hypothetical protein
VDTGKDKVSDGAYRIGVRIKSQEQLWLSNSLDKKYAVYISMSPVRHRLIGLWKPRPDC